MYECIVRCESGSLDTNLWSNFGHAHCSPTSPLFCHTADRNELTQVDVVEAIFSLSHGVPKANNISKTQINSHYLPVIHLNDQKQSWLLSPAYERYLCVTPYT